MMLLSFRSFCFLRLTLGISGLRQMGITAHVKFPRSPSLARITLSITCGAKRRQVHPAVRRIQWDAFRAQRTGARLPDPTWKRCERFEGNTVCCCEFASYEAVHGECSDSNRLSAALPQRGECAADSRTGVDDVVDDRDALASDLGLKGLWDRV